MDKKFIKNIIITIAVAVLAFALYFFFFRGSGTNNDSGLSVEPIIGKTSTVDKSLLTLLLEMKSVKLDEELFNSAVFKSLNDYSIKIEPQEVGRINPFAPLETKK
ncbi:MAG: hypothetical protein AAB334_02815 [Patescibacteria group bacterium]